MKARKSLTSLYTKRSPKEAPDSSRERKGVKGVELPCS